MSRVSFVWMMLKRSDGMRAWCVGAVMVCAGVARGGMAPDYDFQWAVIGDVGNAPFPGPPVLSSSYMRGDVDYEYRISKLEVTSAQWLEFLNTIGPLDPAFTAANLEPTVWGGRRDFSFPDGYRYRFRSDAPAPAMVPLNGISWRAAAMYCNWLHNDKAPTLDAIRSGAYDTSTFGDLPGGAISDQREHSPGATFWIPTLDEWLKAVHYDPDRYGEGEGGWWNYPITSDTVPVSGLPGTPGAQTSAGLVGTSPTPRLIPLGAYPDVQSPWGLLDTSGGASEWTEEFVARGDRLVRGSGAGDSGYEWLDHIGDAVSNPPALTWNTLRIASVLPSGGTAMPLLVAGCISIRRRR